jgi:hypothetical protein
MRTTVHPGSRIGAYPVNPISHNRASFLRRKLQDQRGAVVLRVAFMTTLFLGAGGLAMAIGRANFRSNELPVSTDEAALAGAPSVANSTGAATTRRRGKAPTPHNVAIIVDTTSAMSTVDRQCNDESNLACALAGVRNLLNNLSPCRPSESTCGAATSGNVANAVDRVSLFVFPNVAVGTAINDYNCGSKGPTNEPYSTPTAGASTYAPSSWPAQTPTYRIVDYSSDYRISDMATTLNPDSDLVKAVGGTSGCPFMRPIGGMGTYYAGAIYAAQASLVAEQAARPDSVNVMILITDGFANSRQNQFQPGATDSGTYPSWVDECGQAIVAAKTATKAGTRVYAVAYGAASSPCVTDTSGPYRGYSPCRMMRSIASSHAYFFSSPMVFTPSGSQVPQRTTCDSASHSATNLNLIFTEIATSIKAARSIPKRRRRPPS